MARLSDDFILRMYPRVYVDVATLQHAFALYAARHGWYYRRVNKTAKYILGVDPGKHGGFCALPIDSAHPQIFIPVPLNGTEVDIPMMIQHLRNLAPGVLYAVMEEVHAIFGSSAKSTFNFGHINGAMETALHAAGIPLVKVQPKVWQKEAWRGTERVESPTGKLNKRTGAPVMKVDTKATSLRAAKHLWPTETFLASTRSRNPHDGWVDAALIAYWGMQKYGTTVRK